MKKVNLLFLTVLCMFIFGACDNSQPYENEHSEIIVRGVSDDATARTENNDGISDYSKCPIILKGNNIKWFNPRTREIKFSQIEPFEIFEWHRRIAFEINGEVLFTAETIITDAASFTRTDLVLYYDLFGKKYYLKDAYPDLALDFEETKQNIEKRKDGWNKFTTQMRKEKRLRQ